MTSGCRDSNNLLSIQSCIMLSTAQQFRTSFAHGPMEKPTNWPSFIFPSPSSLTPTQSSLKSVYSTSKICAPFLPSFLTGAASIFLPTPSTLASPQTQLLFLGCLPPSTAHLYQGRGLDLPSQAGWKPPEPTLAFQPLPAWCLLGSVFPLASLPPLQPICGLPHRCDCGWLPAPPVPETGLGTRPAKGMME